MSKIGSLNDSKIVKKPGIDKKVKLSQIKGTNMIMKFLQK